MNFFHPNVALPLQKSLTGDESLAWIKTMRREMPRQRIMIAGGREITFKDSFWRLWLPVGLYVLAILPALCRFIFFCLLTGSR